MTPYAPKQGTGYGEKVFGERAAHRMKFCVQKGLGGVALNKQFVANG